MPKEQLKDKVDGNELDLSLSSLTTIPVNELATLPRATRIDLSCNLITKLPNEFCNLQHIVHLDLSKNQLTELPFNFGGLKKLQHLDLFNNKLTTLPVSIFQMKKLKWLDLKDNPLTEPLKSLVGDCLDEKQCRACASKVLDFMTKIQGEQERQLQKRLQTERELEAKQKAEEEKQKQLIKEERKREKERRKKEHEERIKLEKKESEKVPHVSHAEENGKKTTKAKAAKKPKPKTGLSCGGVLLAVIIGLIAIGIGLYFYCASHSADKACHQILNIVEPYITQGYQITDKYLKKAQIYLNEYVGNKGK